MRVTSWIVIGLSTVVAHSAAAQLPPAIATPRTEVLASAVGELQPSQRIMVAQSGVGRIEGTFFTRSDSSLGLLSRRTERVVLLANIDTLWTRTNPASRAGLIGAIAGGLIGAFTLGEFSNAYEPETAAGARGYVGGALVGAAVGLALGAAVGSTLPHWKIRFPDVGALGRVSQAISIHPTRRRSGGARKQSARPPFQEPAIIPRAVTAADRVPRPSSLELPPR